jgi:hypothetical protein
MPVQRMHVEDVVNLFPTQNKDSNKHSKTYLNICKEGFWSGVYVMLEKCWDERVKHWGCAGSCTMKHRR